MIKVKRYWYCCCIVGLFCASSMAGGPDAEFYFSPDGVEPGVGGDLTITVAPGGGTVCVDLYARSLTGADIPSLGTEVTFNETANFSAGGTLDADCASTCIALFPGCGGAHAFQCDPDRWSTKLINPGPDDCTNGPVHFVHAAGGPPPSTCDVPDGSGLYIAELCYDYSADACGTATITDKGVVSLGDANGDPLPNGAVFRPLTINVAPANDDCDNAQTISGGQTQFDGACATPDGDGGPSCGVGLKEQDIWWQTEPQPLAGEWNLIFDGPVDHNMQVYNKVTCPPGPPDEKGCAFPGEELRITVLPGDTLLIRIAGPNQPDKTGKLFAEFKSDVEPPICPSFAPVDPIYLFSGEFHESVVDLRIEGRGLDFTWGRKYRSKIGPNTAQGNGLDCTYNIRLEARGQNLALFDGNTREDVYLLQPDGAWARREFFRVFEQNLDDSYTLTFSDTGTWNFNALDGSPAAGKISSIVDRNENTIAFDYDGLGRLVTIHDPLDTPAHDRDITVTYTPDGFIESVTDFAGRSVRYEYYDGIEPGGNFGDLKSVTTPAVVNTPDFPIPDGHEYPFGKTTEYTYSTGFADDRLNHNLLTITDPKGQTYLINEYYSTTDPDDLNFDRIRRQTWGDAGDIIDLVYVPQDPTPDNNFAVIKVIVNDRVGNVKEFFYNAPNQSVIAREYTGRADPDQPTTEADNRPTGQLRPGDPVFFETRYVYNEDSLLTRIVHPNGNEEVFTYDTGNENRRSHGNMLEHCRLPGDLGGDQIQICESYEYEDGFGGCCGTNFVTRHVDGRGNETLHPGFPICRLRWRILPNPCLISRPNGDSDAYACL